MAGFAPHKAVEESRAMVQAFMEKDAHWAIVEKSTGCLIGSISLQPDGKRPKIKNARRIGFFCNLIHTVGTELPPPLVENRVKKNRGGIIKMCDRFLHGRLKNFSCGAVLIFLSIIPF